VVVWVAAALFALATVGWGLSVVRRNANVVDALWGPSQIVVAVVSLIAGEDRTARSWVCAALVAVWGLRLALHLMMRDHGRGEDWRYRRARSSTRGFVWRSLPEVFWFQLVGGGLVVGLPMLAAVSDDQPDLGWLDAVGVVVWGAGLAIEAIADAQLRRFTSDATRRDGVLDSGLWRFSRHPNYFGEVVVWVGVALVGIAAGAWWAVVSPVMVFVIITRISGVAVMDEHLRTTRGAAYEVYVRTTSAFVPLPKRPSPRDAP
jgi:steroid 5-alpha reductase family enzyme